MSIRSDTRQFIAALPPEYFPPALPLHIARAPGRLDVMGGISDYSGGLCLEWPLQCATHCAVQRTNDETITVRSANAQDAGWQAQISAPVQALLPHHTSFSKNAEQQWANYVLGALTVLASAYPDFRWSGARIFVASDIPMGAGVASSAAIEVAALYALVAAFDFSPLDSSAPNGLQIARLSQQLENEVVGAPCGIMDQVTCALGRENQLIRLRCQPDLIEGYVSLPDDVKLFGIDSGVKHSVGGQAYTRARCATFMGRRVLQQKLNAAMLGINGEPYLANLTVDMWRAARESFPVKMTGDDFLQNYGHHGDGATQVEPDCEYSLRLATENPIYEGDRVARFAALLDTAQQNDDARDELLRAAGDLMIQSHFSYDHRANLGAPETDVLVRLAREAGPKAGVLGAKITGGGAGGTVAFLTDARRSPDIESIIDDIAAAYEREVGIKPQLLGGSSPGAEYSGPLQITL